MVTVDEAARAARVSARTLYRWVEGEKLHFVETAEGGLLICYESLSARPDRSAGELDADKAAHYSTKED